MKAIADWLVATTWLEREHVIVLCGATILVLVAVCGVLQLIGYIQVITLLDRDTSE